MTIEIEKECNIELSFDPEPIIKKVINEAVDYEDCPYECMVSVILTDNDGIWEINKEQRNIDAPTDVLSFPMIDYFEPGNFEFLEEDEFAFEPESGELVLGDIIISLDKVKEQASAYGHSEQRELAFLVAHSMLHLFGYDHMEDDERIVMEEKQEEILQNTNFVRE